MTYAHAFRLWLELNVHPLAPWALLTLLCGGAVYAIRTYTPAAWAWLFAQQLETGSTAGHVLQALPATLLGALLDAASNGGDFETAWRGALVGALAPIFHHVAKASPLIPYRGALGPRAEPDARSGPRDE